MERAAWTDKRLDDLAEGMRSGFVRVDHDIRDFKVEVREQFRDARGEIRAVRTDIASLKTMLIRLSGAGMIGLLGIIAAILTRGV